MSYGNIIEMKSFMKIEDVAELIKDNINIIIEMKK